jgi:hypothetical protein
MSHVRPRLEVTADQPMQRFSCSAFAGSSSPEKKFLVFARFGGRACQWLRRQSFSARSSASWHSAAHSTPLAAHFCSRASAPRAAVNRRFSSLRGGSCFGGPELSASSGGVRGPCLTLPSRGRPKPFGFRPPLMSNVRPRLEVAVNHPMQRFSYSAFAESSSLEKKFLVFARFGERARQWLRRQRLSTRPSASWCPATCRAPLAAQFWSHAYSPLAAVNRSLSSHRSGSCFRGLRLLASSGGVRPPRLSSPLASAGNASKMRSGSWAGAIRARPNPSIERTSKTLRLSAASHVKR